MDLNEMKKIKKEHGFSIADISEGSGVPLGTLAKVLSGQTESPRKGTIDALEKFFTRIKTDTGLRKAAYDPGHCETDDLVREGSALYMADAPHTIENYYALPEDVRAELIDGRFYNMSAPSYVHQELVGELAARIRECIRKHNMPCRVFVSPCDVQLDGDEYTMVQPDVLVLCDPGKLKYNVLFGAPDFVAEVLSPATRLKDLSVKVGKYRAAGVREYWIIDSESEQVVVYLFEENDIPRIYDRESVIPVKISGGLCSIDFGEVWADIVELNNWGKV